MSWSIFSITSRNAKGADLLVTDQAYKKTWSIQVKTNRKAAGFWLMGTGYKVMASPTHLYIVGLREIEWVNFGGGSAKNLCIG